MKTLINRLHNYQTLDKHDARDALLHITAGNCNEAHIVSFLSAYQMRRPTIEELEGFRDAMMSLCTPISFDIDTLDIVGTGGDGKNTFNISTLAAIVVAAAGIKVAKHGNYAVSSVSGSSNVLEHLGYKFISDPILLQEQLHKHDICFLHAPLFHPAMKNVAHIRKNLGIRTFFNLLGPLINPARPAKQVLGVSDMGLARMYHYLLQDTNQQYIILHSFDGYDEISLTGSFKILTRTEENIYAPQLLGFDKILPGEIETGDTVSDAASIFLNVLNGTATKAQQNVVIANAAFAIHCNDAGLPLVDCIDMAQESLKSKKAFNLFKQITHA